MSWGFTTTNNYGQVLISSDTKNLHFIGKASFNRVISSSPNMGGMCRYAYRIDCRSYPMPFFTMNSNYYHGILAIRNISGITWEIELAISRNETANTVRPEIYVFSDPSAATPSYESHGMIIYKDDGSVSFDSRLSPLNVTNGLIVSHPTNPYAGVTPSFSAQYCSSNSSLLAQTNYNAYNFDKFETKPIYYFPSIAQSEREYHFSAWDHQTSYLGLKDKYYYWDSVYWVFYRGGIRNNSSGGIDAGWMPIEFGCNHAERYEKGISIIGWTYDDGNTSGGSWPYSNKSLNLSNVGVIMTDGSLYDSI